MFVVLFHRNSDEFTRKTTNCDLRLSPLVMRIPCSVALNLFLITEVCGFSTLGLAPWARGVKISRGFNVEFCVRSSPHRRRDGCCNTPAMVEPNDGPSSRGQFARISATGFAAGFGVVGALGRTEPAGAAGRSLEELTADIMIAKEVFQPTLVYLKAEQFDAARTNTNYITRFLNLKKTIDELIVGASDLVDDPDVLEKAVDMAQETQALFTNFDSSVYTIIFIPPDEGGVLPPGAEKYLNQAYGYYADINKLFDFYLSLVPSETQTKAQKLLPAKRSTLPKSLFKEGMREKVSTS